MHSNLYSRSAGRTGQTPDVTTRLLSAPRRQFVQVLQRVRYGRLHRLQVRGGDPVLTPELRWTRTIKVGGDNSPHPLAAALQYVLRREFVHFFALLDEIGDGAIENVEVRNGLPLAFEVVESYRS